MYNKKKVNKCIGAACLKKLIWNANFEANQHVCTLSLQHVDELRMKAYYDKQV